MLYALFGDLHHLVSSLFLNKMNVSELQQMHNSLAESFLKFHAYLALILS